MCGIIGYTGYEAAIDSLLAGLDTLSYRGYDSAGIAVAGEGGIHTCRAAGKLDALRKKLQSGVVFGGCCGIGHTRWATHGAPTEQNAHPHTNGGQVAVVHNGIIENHAALRQELETVGVRFLSETDTEVIPHLLAHYRTMHASPIDALRHTLARLEGAYALAILFEETPDRVFAVRQKSPLAVARGEKGSYLASDVTALLPYTHEVCYLEEGEIACLEREDITLYRADGTVHPPTWTNVEWGAVDTGKGGYRHYMEKELHEVPMAVEKTVALAHSRLPLGGTIGEELFASLDEVKFVGCGSAYHVGIAAALTGEERVGIRATAENASEFRYRRAVLSEHALVVAISQSGETADTLAAVEEAKRRGIPTLAIVNVPSSAIARAAEYVFYTQAGPEIAVATTKAYCAQYAACLCLWEAVLQAKGRKREADEMRAAIGKTAACCREILASTEKIKGMAKRFVYKRDVFYIGRGVDAAVCREGALKLKEITYLHAEAFEAGELKHGTISLIEEGTPVLAVVTRASTAEKMASNMREVQARGAVVVAVAAPHLPLPQKTECYFLPSCSEEILPLLAAFVMQLLAYEVCVRMGGDVDKPRNLAKSVTVE